MARGIRTTTTTPRLSRLTITLVTILAIMASACSPAAAPAAPTAAPSQPTAVVQPTAAPPSQPTPAPTARPLAIATTAPTPAPVGKPSPVLNVVLGTEPTSLDASIDTLKSSLVIQNTIIESLAVNTPDQKFKPWLAESWEPITPTKWRLKLKKGVKFHNGEPFNADAVAFSFDVFMNTKGMARGYFSHVAGTEKVDDYTIDVITKEPSSILPSSLAYLYIHPPKYTAEVGQNFGHKPIGTGPYRFVEWTKGVLLKVAANPDYWGKKPSIPEIQFRWAPEAAARVAMLETGEVHLAEVIPPALIERVERSGTARVEVIKSIRKVFLGINTYDGATKDVRVRKALNHAIDVGTIIKTLFRGRAYGRDTGVIFDGFEGYQGDKLQAYTYDPDLAKKLLAEAGFPNGFEMPFWHTIGRYMLDKESSEAMAAYLGKIGVKASLQGMEAGAYFTKVNAERVPGVHFRTCGPLFMNTLFCTRLHFELGEPRAYAATERADAYIKTVGSTLDDVKRVRAYQEFENYIFYEHVPWVWLWHQQDAYGVSSKVNWKPRTDELITFEEVSFR